jgi:hypothetical protein
VETITVSSWQEFTDLSLELDGWAFRGQQDANWLLQSSLSRYLAAFVRDGSNWRVQEQRAIRIFRRKAHTYISDARVLSDDLRCLGLMQHHGAPTRLLDFTKSPYVAAFFALERAVGQAAVYAVNTPALYTDRAVPATTPSLTREMIDPRKEGNFEKYFLPDVNPVIWFGEPTEMDRRLVAQAGTFMVPGLLHQPLDRIFEHYSSDVDLVRKIVMPLSVRDEGMRSLYRMNITNASLFPDLEGLARSIALELEVVWPRA